MRVCKSEIALLSFGSCFLASALERSVFFSFSILMERSVTPCALAMAGKDVPGAGALPPARSPPQPLSLEPAADEDKAYYEYEYYDDDEDDQDIVVQMTKPTASTPWGLQLHFPSSSTRPTVRAVGGIAADTALKEGALCPHTTRTVSPSSALLRACTALARARAQATQSWRSTACSSRAWTTRGARCQARASRSSSVCGADAQRPRGEGSRRPRAGGR